MQYIRREHFLHCVGLSASSYDVMAMKHHVALAFGLPIPAVAGHYLALDTVAMCIANGLTKSVGRDMASAIALWYFDKWADAVGRTDFEEQEMFFVVGVEDSAPEFIIASGTQDEINRGFQAQMFKLDRVVIMSITKLVANVRERARSAVPGPVSALLSSAGPPRLRAPTRRGKGGAGRPP